MHTIEDQSHGLGSGVVAWPEALLRPGYSSLYDSMVEELAEYLGESPEVIAAGCQHGAESVAQDWQQRQLHKGSPTAQVLDFYRTTKSYLFDLTTFNAEYPHTATLKAVLDMARRRGFTRFLDFGAGIGSVGLFFAANGMEVALADISEPLQHYVDWRFKIRGLNVRLINLNQEELPRNAFQVVTAFDVVEHLPQPGPTIRSLAGSLKMGGLAAFNVSQSDPRFPQHIASYEEALSSVAASGFRRLRFSGSTEIFERVERSTVSSLWQSWWGTIWYGFLYRKTVRVLEVLGMKTTLRKWIRGR